jgi:molybdopterin synthase sulfur carrier subunit
VKPLKVTLRFVGSFCSLTGKRTLSITLDKSESLRKVIDNFTEKSPKLKNALIDPELEKSRANTLVIVNGKEISVLKGLETKLKDGDEVVFVPVSHGG